MVAVEEVLLADSPEWNLDRYVSPPVKLLRTMSVMPALVRLQRARRAMGIVVDSHGRAVGIVTLKDLVEEIVGDLEAW